MHRLFVSRLAAVSSLALAAAGGCRSGGSVVPAGSSVPASGRVYTLMPTPETVVWGGYDPFAEPALRIASGDAVDVGTVSTCSPTTLLRNGVDSTRIEQSVKDIYAARPRMKTGPGGHILTGPIYVAGADSGDVLEVRIERIDLAIPYACNSFSSRSGFLPEDFPNTAKTKIVPLDAKTMTGEFSPGIHIPLHPFFGSMGVAPAKALGRVNSAPPGTHAGNLDNKELVAGTTLFIPVFNAGALFEVGDGHAAQGNGEVDITALETSLRGRLRFIVRKDMHLKWPRAETPTHWIAMATDSNLVVATKNAVREAIDLVSTTRGLSREDAYMLTSVAGDVAITQLVDGTVGVHVMIPKAIFR